MSTDTFRTRYLKTCLSFLNMLSLPRASFTIKVRLIYTSHKISHYNPNTNLFSVHLYGQFRNGSPFATPRPETDILEKLSGTTDYVIVYLVLSTVDNNHAPVFLIFLFSLQAGKLRILNTRFEGRMLDFMENFNTF